MKTKTVAVVLLITFILAACARAVTVVPTEMAVSTAVAAITPTSIPTLPEAAYYVAPTGNDSNPGTMDQPWRTIQKAADTLTAGDAVYIRAGTYRERVVPANSGSEGNIITYAAYPGEVVTIDGTGVDVPEYCGLFDLTGRSYMRVSGLRVINSAYYGIVADNSGYITIENNYTYNTYSSGISAWSSHHVLVDHNEVVGACTGIWQESLSISNTDTFEVRYNLVHDVMPGTEGKEGITIKDASTHGKVYGNQVYNLKHVGIYVDAEAGHLFDIEVYQNVVYSIEAMGFALASEQGGLLENIRLYNNIAYDNLVGLWLSACCVATHPFKDITIINNTFAYNGRDAWGGGIGIENLQVQNVVIRNNISSQNIYSQMSADSSVLSALTVDHNLTDGDRDPEFEFYGVGDLIDVSPLFANPLEVDFHLGLASPAIDSGNPLDAPATDFNGDSRPQDGNGDGTSQHDIGAYELAASSNPTSYQNTVEQRQRSSAAQKFRRNEQRRFAPLNGVYTTFRQNPAPKPGPCPPTRHYPSRVLRDPQGSAQGCFATLQKACGGFPRPHPQGAKRGCCARMIIRKGCYAICVDRDLKGE